MLTNSRPTYEWSKVLNFTNRGNAQSYCTSGWSNAEPTLIWTDGLNARMSFSAKAPKSDVSFIMACTPYLGDGLVPFQELHVFVNFLRVGFAALAQSAEIEISIPAYVFNRAEADVDFYLPRACSPASVGATSDLRVLGIAVHRIMMAEI
jgi:hypothetical protein